MRHSLQLLEGSILILTRTQTSQVLDCTQKPSLSRSQCLDSPAPKYSELLTSHHGSLRSKGHIYPYPFASNSWAEESSAGGHRSVQCTPTLTCILYQCLHTPWFTRITNEYSTQRSHMIHHRPSNDVSRSQTNLRITRHILSICQTI